MARPGWARGSLSRRRWGPPGPQSAEGPWAEWTWLRSSKEVPAALASRGPACALRTPEVERVVSGDQHSQGGRDEGAPQDCGKGPASAPGPGRVSESLLTPQASVFSSVTCGTGAAALTPHAREAGVIEGVEMCLSGTAQLHASAGRFVCWGSCWPRDLRPALPPLGGTVHQRTRGRALHAATPHRLLAVPLSITPLDSWGN